MQNFDKDLLIFLGIFIAMFYLFYYSLLKYKKLTTYQQHSRWEMINKQGFILAFILAFAYGVDFISKSYLHQFFIDVTHKQISQDMFVLYVFVAFSGIIFLIKLKIDSYINYKDERVVNIQQEATFSNFSPKPRKVKPIKFYAHYFNGITFERSPKDYTIQAVKLNIDLNDIQKFKIEQEAKAVVINDFYQRLIDYINSKASLFGYEKITQLEIQECNNMLDLKILIFNRFENLTNKQYFASISQLFQIAMKNDETEYLAFLRDSQHFKFSSISIKHAALFLQMGVLK